MKHFFLNRLIPFEDVDFLNSTEIFFEFTKTTEDDSGWCDASTGSRILTEHDSVMFRVRCPEEELILLLRYGERISDMS